MLCRHEQGAAHAAEGYARSTGKPGVVLVTSGPGATNAVTGLTDALMDSIPMVVLTGQVATHLIGNDAFQECDTVGITRPCTKHNWLVKDVNDLARVMHEAFQIATTGRPGPVVVDIPKDVQFKKGAYVAPESVQHRTYRPKTDPELGVIVKAVEMMAAAKKPVFYTGGGIINSGPEASRLLRELVQLTGFPITSTLMGLGAYPASDPQWLGMLGMHGTYEANNAMHDCDVMICLGARFDDRVTGADRQVLAGFEEDPSRYRCLADQQECAGRSAHCRRCGQGAEGDAALLEDAEDEGRFRGAGGMVEADRGLAGAESLTYKPSKTDQAAICDRPALRGSRAAATSTSPPRSASTRCGRPSASGSRSQTTG